MADCADVTTWHGGCCVTLSTDVLTRRMVGWRVSNSMRTDFVPETLTLVLVLVP